jgi:hypothetical protein
MEHFQQSFGVGIKYSFEPKNEGSFTDERALIEYIDR